MLEKICKIVFFGSLIGLFCPIAKVCNGVGDCPDSSLAPLGGPTDEEGCRSWSSWGPWSPCSASCDTGSMSRKRICPPGDPLYQCRGQDLQRQQCFNTTCPGRGVSHQINMIHLLIKCNSLLLSSAVDGQWLPWASWSNCSSSCGGVRVRHRGCVPPRYGGLDCSQLPGPSNLPMEIGKIWLHREALLENLL